MQFIFTFSQLDTICRFFLPSLLFRHFTLKNASYKLVALLSLPFGENERFHSRVVYFYSKPGNEDSFACARKIVEFGSTATLEGYVFYCTQKTIEIENEREGREWPKL